MDVDGWERMFECIRGDCNYAFLAPWIWSREFFNESKDVVSEVDRWGVWITNKKWPLNQELATHILYYQQVNIT